MVAKATTTSSASRTAPRAWKMCRRRAKTHGTSSATATTISTPPPEPSIPTTKTPNAYGAQADLDYYGAYQDIPGYGESWQPYDVGSDWDPFDNGAWSYYPDWGWTFVSAYPWGWCPFYYGNWNYINGRGWWWHSGPRRDHGDRPGGGFHPQPALASAPHGFSAPRPPAGSSRRTVAVAGSHLRVGPIGVTHASITHESTALDNATRARISTLPTAAAIRAQGHSDLVHGGNPASSRAGSLIGGQRGAYYVTRPTSGRVAYDVNRPAGSSGGGLRSAPRATAYSGESPRSYSYGGSYAPSYAPRAYSAPSASHFSGGGGGFSSGASHGGGGFQAPAWEEEDSTAEAVAADSLLLGTDEKAGCPTFDALLLRG